MGGKYCKTQEKGGETSDSQEYSLFQTYVQNFFSDNRQGDLNTPRQEERFTYWARQEWGSVSYFTNGSVTKHLIKIIKGNKYEEHKVSWERVVTISVTKSRVWRKAMFSLTSYLSNHSLGVHILKESTQNSQGQIWNTSELRDTKELPGDPFPWNFLPKDYGQAFEIVTQTPLE